MQEAPGGGFTPGSSPSSAFAGSPVQPGGASAGVGLFMGREHLEQSDSAPASALPPGNAVAPGGTVAPALAPLGANQVASSGIASQAAQAATNSLAQQHPLATDPDSPSGDRASSWPSMASTRGDARTVVDPYRLAHVSGRTIFATTSTSAEAPSPTGPGPLDADSDEANLLPRGADLLAEALPFAGDSLERGLEEFVRQLESVDMAGIVSRGPTPIVVASLAVAGTVASAVVAREVLRRRSGRGAGLRLVDPLGRELALSFPELPRSWSEKH